MIIFPAALKAQFENFLQKKAIPENLQGVYKKWLHYYMDFCEKYRAPSRQKESLPLFIRKLQEKKQSRVQQDQATMAITLYYEMFNLNVDGDVVGYVVGYVDSFKSFLLSVLETKEVVIHTHFHHFLSL